MLNGLRPNPNPRKNPYRERMLVIDDVSAASIDVTSVYAGNLIQTTSNSAVTVNLSPSAKKGVTVSFFQKGLGQLTFATGGSSPALRNRSSQTKSAGQYAFCTVTVVNNPTGSNAEWALAGDTGS